MRIVTSGKPFLDIDGYGGIIAYAELLQKQGGQSIGVSTSRPNGSITPTIRSWGAPLRTAYVPKPDDTFVIIDVCDPEAFDTIVVPDRIEQIIDHHPGLEKFWHDKLGDKAQIELVGAACTLVYEHWVQSGLAGQISQTSARLLICGILDNTLNFGAKITTQRDHNAYKALLAITSLPDDWTNQYFTECQQAVLADIPTAISDDLKLMAVPSWQERIPIGQLCVWDAQTLVNTHLSEIKNSMQQKGEHWFMNIISISQNRSYLVCEDAAMQPWLAKLLDLKFTHDVATATRMWLRKEIMNKALNREGTKP